MTAYSNQANSRPNLESRASTACQGFGSLLPAAKVQRLDDTRRAYSSTLDARADLNSDAADPGVEWQKDNSIRGQT